MSAPTTPTARRPCCGHRTKAPPDALTARLRADPIRDFPGFLIGHDNYYRTHSPENQARAELIYNRARAAGHIFTEQVEQLFDPVQGLFLADRFVRGGCSIGSSRLGRRPDELFATRSSLV